MKNMMKILGLVGLMTLVSCNDGGTKKWVSDCASDQIAGHECEAPPTTPEVEAEFVLTEVTSLTFNGKTLKTPKFNGFKMTLESDSNWVPHPSGDGDLDTVQKTFLTFSEDGTGKLELKSRGFYDFHYTTILNTVELEWEIVGNELLINGTSVNFSL